MSWKRKMIMSSSQASDQASQDHKVLGIRNLTSDTFVFRVDRKDFQFAAGQLVSLGPRGLGVNREYSIYSGENEDYLEFLIRKIKSGTVSVALSKAKSGDRVFILGPYSEFKIKNTAKGRRPHVFIATGTGIAPFRSMIRSTPGLNYQLIHGVRFLAERYDFQEYAQGSYLACVTGEKCSSAEGVTQGRVTQYLRTMDLPPKAAYYLCGNNKMITDVYQLLQERGVSPDDINSEVFF